MIKSNDVQDDVIGGVLAEHSFQVLGFDFSGPAIDIAKSQHRGSPGSLEFKVMDVYQEAPA